MDTLDEATDAGLKREPRTYLVFLVTTHHADQALGMLPDTDDEVHIHIARTQSQRSREAVEYFIANCRTRPNIRLMDTWTFTTRMKRPTGSTWRVVGQALIDAARRRPPAIDVAITAYPYAPTSLMYSRALGARTIMAIDDGLSVPVFTGIDDHLAEQIKHVAVPEPRLQEPLHPRPKAQAVRHWMRQALDRIERAGARALLGPHSGLSIQFTTAYPLRRRPNWSLKRTVVEPLDDMEVGQWVLIIGSPFNEILGQVRGNHERELLIKDAATIYPDCELVYRPHPLESIEWAQTDAELSERLTIDSTSPNWRTAFDERGSLPRATFSVNSTLAHLISDASGLRVQTHLSTRPLGDPESWRKAIDAFLALVAEQDMQVGIVEGPATFQIVHDDRLTAERPER